MNGEHDCGAVPDAPGTGAVSTRERESCAGVPVRESIRHGAVMRMTARHMHASHGETAPITIFAEADASELVRVRAAVSGRPGGASVTYSHLLMKVLATALTRHPRLNAAFVDDTVKVFDEVNIGMATTLPDGNLIVPVIHGVDRLGIVELAQVARELQARAQKGALRPADVRGGTFTFSNVGMLASVRWVTPLLNLPQCAILGTGAIAERAVVREGRVVARWMLPLSLTIDHRALNGYAGASFVDSLAQLVADPSQLLGLAA